MKLTVETLQNLSFNHCKTFNNLTKHLENLTKAKKDRQKTGKKGNTNQLVGPANHPHNHKETYIFTLQKKH